MSDNCPEDIELHRPFIDAVTIKCPECGKQMHRVTEVIDCWFDSGSMPFAQWHYPFENQDIFEKHFPADFISEAVDQTRGWFYSLMAISTLLFDKAPFKNVIVLGHVQDKDGQKMSDDDEDSLTYQTLEHIQVNDYKVGDTIAIVNTDKLFTETQKAIEQADIAKTGGDRAADTIADPDAEKRISIANEVYDRLVAEGDYTTYTVEGILDLGDMLTGESGIQVYTSVDNYLAETGYTESQISGMEYQIDSTRITNRSIDDMVSYLYTDTGTFDFYMYVENLRTFQSFKEFNRVILMIAALVFALGVVNIINATAGNLHMRRKEFAQLRVIGMSRKRLIKTVLLEGIMTAFWSNILGILIGTGVYYGEYYFIRLMFQMRFAPSVTAIVVGVVLSTILVFGSILIPLRRLPQSMAEDLTLEE